MTCFIAYAHQHSITGSFLKLLKAGLSFTATTTHCLVLAMAADIMKLMEIATLGVRDKGAK